MVLATLPLARPARTSAPVTQEWAAPYNGPADSHDIASALAVDGNGNTYVTGYSLSVASGFDYATVKYDSAGNQVWAARYNGPMNSHDIAVALAVDGSGNVYVTGYTDGAGTGTDYTTVKYDSAGNQVWAARYNGPANDTDYPATLAVDGGGNVYVTGLSAGVGTNNDYATVKYDSAGNQVWATRYNGPANSADAALALALDGGGNVYVTGNSFGIGTGQDYATLKYDSAGNQAWVARYNGPENSHDYAKALAVDGGGNVYVTGHTWAGTGEDYATVKYNSAGGQLWATYYNGPENSDDQSNGLAVDGSGNVYVTGYSRGVSAGYDYATVKYNSAGSQLWAARYNGPETDSDDQAAALKVVGGNVYVTGSSTGVGAGTDYATVKYNSAGNQVWVARYNGPGNASDNATALAVDGGGNVYVTGYSLGTNGYDYATFKYSQPSVISSPTYQVWAAPYNGAANGHDIAVALAVDGSGNVYVTGYSLSAAAGFDYATVKYNSAGTQVWAVRYNGPANDADAASALALDSGGNIYVTGASFGAGAIDYDYATVKYDSAGTQVWATHYNGPGNGYDYASALALDGGGNIYVTGSSYGVGTNTDYATVKYDSAGSQVWAARYDGPSNGYDNAVGLAVVGGNVYVGGSSAGVGTSTDYATVKYNSSGSQVWTARYNGPANNSDQASALKVDGSGNVYVTGTSNGGAAGDDYATVKYDSAGTQVWAARHDGPASAGDVAAAIGVDSGGNIYVTGSSYGGDTTDNDYATVKYDGAGTELWAVRYNGPASSTDSAAALAVDGSGNVYVTGYSLGANGYDYATVKYSQTPPDTTAPTCVVGAVVTESSTRVYLPITASDTGSGVAQAKLTTNSTNCKLEWTGPGGVVAVPINTLLVISPAAASTTLRVVKLNASQKARVEVQVWDAAGNRTVVDPVIANLESKRAGAPVLRTFRGIPQAERFVTLQNGTPGLTQVTLSVNGRGVSHGRVADGQVVSLDVARWLRPGNRNVISISAIGPKGATAVLTIGDVAPVDAGVASTTTGMVVNREFAP